MQTKRCTKCGTEKPHNQFNKDKYKPLGLRYVCKCCEAAYRLSTKALNDARNAAYYVAHKDEASTRMKTWRKANPHIHNALEAKRRAVKLQATPPWLTKDDFAAIQQFYTMSNQLTELNGKIYHVDHIIPLLGKTVCGLHVPWNLQILDGPENLAKSNKLVLPAELAWN